MLESGSIWVELDTVARNLKLMAEGMTEFPESSAMAETIGSSVGVTEGFKSELDRTSRRLSSIVEVMKLEIEGTKEAMQLAVRDMVATDVLAAGEAEQILALVDSAVDPSTSSRPTSGSTIRPPQTNFVSTEPNAPAGYGT